MTPAVAQNSTARDQLRSFVERMEAIAADKKQLSEDSKQVMAEAKATGFVPAAIRAVLKIRAMKPNDRAEADMMLDLYLHAMGMATEPPLHAASSLAGVDTTAREQVLAAMREFVPGYGLGAFVLSWGGKALRLERNIAGEVVEMEVAPAAPPAAPPKTTKAKAVEVTADGDEAEQLGRAAAMENRPIVDNPFAFGDPRRSRFDVGWRRHFIRDLPEDSEGGSDPP